MTLHSDDLMQLALVAAGVGMYAFDHDGVVLVTNQAAAELLDWPAEELVGRRAHDTFHHTGRDGRPTPAQDCRVLRPTRTGIGDHDDEDLFWRRDGRPLPVWWISAPMRVDNGTRSDASGVVVFGDASERQARDVDKDIRMQAAELRREYAERAFHEARAVSELAEAETARLTVLASLSGLLNILEVLPGLDRVAELVSAELADACVIDRLDEHGRISRVSLAATDLAASDVTRELHPMPALKSAARGSLAMVLSGASSQEVVDLTTPVTRPLANPLDEQQALLFDLLGARHAVVVPLSAAGRVLGAMTWVRRDGSAPFDPADLLMATLFGLRIGQWMENLRLNELRQNAAVTLQRSLLTSLPEPDDIEIVARYLPAAEGVEIGGDWYDAFVSYAGHTVIAIGDVTGHDIAAATRMAQLRSMLRFAALHEPLRPSAALDAVDRAMPALGIEGLASVLLGTLARDEHGDRSFVWCNGGHLPPVLIDPDETVRLLDNPADLILGVDATAERGDHVVQLAEGATLVLYTDGLVERREEDIRDGLARLVAAATALAGRALPDLCEGLLAELTPVAGPMDDIALIAVRLRGRSR